MLCCLLLPLHTTKEISQPPLALGTATSNHSDSANIDESLDNSAQGIVADSAPHLYSDDFLKYVESTSKTLTRNMPVKEGQVDEHIPLPKSAESIKKGRKGRRSLLGENPHPRTRAKVAATGSTPSPNRPDINRSATSTRISQNPVNIVSSGPVVKPSASIAPKVAQVTSHRYSNSYGAPEKSNAGTEDASLSESAKRKVNKWLYEENSTAEPPVVGMNPYTAEVATRAKESVDAFREFRLSYMQEHEASRLEKARKGREERVDELKEFSESFKLDAPIPRDLLPILAKDVVKQQHIQAKASKDAEPSLEPYEPSLEDAKRSVGQPRG